MADCNHECSSCATSGGCQEKEQNERAINNTKGVKKVIGVVGGKGGVGKSLVTSLLAIQTRRLGYETAVLDADITGPSIPKIFGIHDHAQTDEQNLLPYIAADGTKVMSLNLLLENETDPVVWRGPVIAGAVKQFWQDVIWKDVDFMFVDMPPGTGDVPLTVFQSLPVDGIIVVTSPQQLVSLIVEKAVNMAAMMNVPVLGVVENMAWAVCPHCGEKLYVFGESHVEEVAAAHGLPVLARCPLNPQLAKQADLGVIESFEGETLDKAADAVENLM